MSSVARQRRGAPADADAALARITGRRDKAPSPASQPLGERAYRALREAIHEGTIEPDTHLTEVDVAAWLQMSRTPVREAMRRLESEGVLRNQPFRGAVVVAIDERQLRELYAVRELLEVAAAGWCAANATEAQLDALREITAAESKATRDPRALSKLNRRFHDEICQGARNEFLLKALATVHTSFALLGKSNLLTAGRARVSIAEHRELLAAIEKRDTEAAEAAARKHVRRSLEQRLKELGARAAATF
ncbi:MAG TPA: GntR family transcriptional regulator [Burkholderiales bacterium]|nr:GntR family transcriptional regulator [Burkholderiales bacterium]